MKRFVIAVLVLAGCSEFPVRSTEFACVTTDDCDGGRTCEQGFCVVGATGGNGTDAAVNEPDAGVDSPPVDPFAQIALMCEAAGYTRDPATGGYYRVSTVNAQWTAANNDCKDDVPGATHLIVLSTQAEVSFLAPKVGGNGMWVGLFDNDTNVFQNVTGEPNDVRPFANGQPDNGGGDENCVQMKQGGQLDDDQCNEGHRYTCECDGKMSTI